MYLRFNRPCLSGKEFELMWQAVVDLWPLLIQTGFKPSQIRLKYHKFGLNLFAAAQKQ